MRRQALGIAESRLAGEVGCSRGQSMTGVDYLAQFGVPNFYFHLTTAYSILRHNGVELGKFDYLGGITLQDA